MKTVITNSTIRRTTLPTTAGMRVATVETKGSKKAANRKRKQEAAKGGSKSDDDDTTPSGAKIHAGKYTPLEYKKLKPFKCTEVKRLQSVEAAARKVSMVVAGPEVPSEADRKPSPTVKTLKKVQFGLSAYADQSQVWTKQVHVRPVQDGPNMV